MFKIGHKSIVIGDLITFTYHGKRRNGYVSNKNQNSGNTVLLEMSEDDRDRYESNMPASLNYLRKQKPCYRSFSLKEIQDLVVS